MRTDVTGNVGACRQQTLRTLASVAALIVLCFSESLRGGQADEAPPVPETPTADADRNPRSNEGQHLITERSVLLQSQMLLEGIAGNQPEAVRDQLRLLGQSDPANMVPGASGAWDPLFRFLFRSVHLLPAATQQELRTEFSKPADAELQQILNRGEMQSLLQLIQRFPGSDASCRAHLILAQRHLNRGHRMAARYWLESLMEPGVPERWQRLVRPVLAALSEGQHVSVDSGSELPDIPEHVHWQHLVELPPAISETLRRLITSAQQSLAIPWTSWQPVVDDQTVFTRTLRGVTALHRKDGKPAWTWAAAASLETPLAIQGRGGDEAAGPPGAAAENLFASLESSAIANVLHRNGVMGRLTADSERLFLVQDDWPAQAAVNQSPFLQRSQGQQSLILPAQLIALEKSTGRRLWTAGGEPVEARYGNELSQAWIAGPPTVHGRLLYCLIEQQDAVFLVCLAAETGDLQWKVLLTYPTVGISRDPARRIQAAIPVAREGLVWVTTTTGWAAAIDLITQSVLWTCRTGKSDGVDESRVVRGRMFAMPSPRSLRSSGPIHPPVLAGNRLVIFSDSSTQIFHLNSLTGELLHTSETPERLLVLHADALRIVLAGPRAVEAISPQDGARLWFTSLADRTANADPGPAPVGAGVVRGQQLLVSMSDGSIRAFDLRSGEQIGSRPHLRTAPVWGGLIDAGGDVLGHSPSQLALLSHSAAAPGSRTVLDQSEQLTAAGDFHAALKLLTNATPGNVDAERVRQLRYRCLVTLIREHASVEEPSDTSDTSDTTHTTDQLSDPQHLLEELKRVAVTTSEQAELIQLRVIHLLRTADGALLMNEIFAAMDDNSAALRQSIEHWYGLSFRAVPGVVRQPLRLWLLQRLAEHLDNADSEKQEGILARLQNQSDEVLLDIVSPAVQSELLKRVAVRTAAGEYDELTLQLLLHAGMVSRLRNSNSVFSKAARSAAKQSEHEESEWTAKFLDFRRQLIRWDAAESAGHVIRRRLLDTLTERLPEQDQREHGGNAQKSVHDEILVSIRGDMTRQWDGWPDQPYSAIPVTQSTAWRQLEQPLAVLTPQDTFLMSHDWQIARTVPLLKGRSVTEQRPQVWSVSGNFPNSSPYVDATDSIVRCGSTLVVRTGNAISAFSVIDQRLLWSRQVSGSGSVSAHTGQRNELLFTEYTVASRPRLAPFLSSDVRLSGVTDRWTLLATGTSLEMIENRSGRTRWELQGLQRQVTAFATDDLVVLINPADRSVSALRTTDGAAVDLPLTWDQLQSTLAAGNDSLVCLRSSIAEDQSISLDWLDPVTGQTLRSVDVGEVRSLQFLDMTALIAMGDDMFHVIDLHSGFVQQCRMPDLSDDDSDVPSKSLTVMADPIHYYVFHRPVAKSPPQTRLVGRDLTQISGRLLVFRRDSGQFRWQMDTANGLSATFDQPMSPILLLIDLGGGNAPNVAAVLGQQGPAMITVHGILKSTGQRLFEHPLSSRVPLPFARMSTNHLYQIDVEAFGSRVRFLPPVTGDDAELPH